MSHDVCVNLGRMSQQDLSSSQVAFIILDSRQLSSRVTSAVEYNLGRLAKECSLKIWKLLANKANAVVILQSLIEVDQMLGRIDSKGSEGNSKLDALGQFRGWQLLELQEIS
jgi:hypothetical protein